ncbi:ParB family protein [Serratia sp. Tan611]|uniref:ParB family protein n=1 Tax=Serratia sp. Tan611 TaxID=2773264 RepID=UPI0019314552|nr:ParB family protein [Serratia sp. Tan611]CAE1141451.1 Integrating conjugative element, PFGI_1 class, ParB family protein [Serratia sp. Tan611]
MGRINTKNIDLGSALLQQGKTAVGTDKSEKVELVQLTSEIPMVLTLDDVSPFPDNPRTSRNPRYEEIKASVRARGLDTVPKITADPERPELGFFFSDGGNTRLQILAELWQETGDEKFFRISCMFKPWPGRLSCLIGHLAENEVRGELSFIEKAFGIKRAREFFEESLGKKVSLRELSNLLGQEGYPVHNSNISRMEDTIQYLYPHMPNLLKSGLGRPQIQHLLSLRVNAYKTWDNFSSDNAAVQDFEGVFGAVCAHFDDPEAYSLEMFRDELIGALVKALPHPSLNYDRWLLELDPKEQNRRQQLGEVHLQGMPNFAVQPMVGSPVDGCGEIDSGAAITSSSSDASVPGTSGLTLSSALDEQDGAEDSSDAEPISSGSPRIETQHDLYGAPPVLSGDVDEQPSPGMSGTETAGVGQPAQPAQPAPVAPEVTPNEESSEVAFAEEGLEPVVSVWAIPALQDDIEHLQGMAYRLAFELAEQAGCETELKADKTTLTAAGYCLATQQSSPFTALLLSLTGPAPDNESCSLSEALIGAADGAGFPLLDDVHAVKFLRLVRVLRRLRELQRDVDTDTGEDA